MYKFTQDFGRHKKGDSYTLGELIIGAILRHLGIIEKVEEGKWKPKDGDTYWCFYGDGSIGFQTGRYNSNVDLERIDFNNCFKTEAACIKARDAVKKLLEGMERE